MPKMLLEPATTLMGRLRQFASMVLTDPADEIYLAQQIAQLPVEEEKKKRPEVDEEVEEAFEENDPRICYRDPLAELNPIFLDDMSSDTDFQSADLVMHIYTLSKDMTSLPMRKFDNFLRECYRFGNGTDMCEVISAAGRLVLGGPPIHPFYDESASPKTPTASLNTPTANSSSASLKTPTANSSSAITIIELEDIDVAQEPSLTLVSVEIQFYNLSRDVEMWLKIGFNEDYWQEFAKLFIASTRTNRTKNTYAHPLSANLMTVLCHTNWPEYVIDRDETHVFILRTFRSLMLLNSLQHFDMIDLGDLSEFDHVTAIPVSRSNWNLILDNVNEIKSQSTPGHFFLQARHFLPKDKDLNVSMNFKLHAACV